MYKTNKIEIYNYPIKLCLIMLFFYNSISSCKKKEEETDIRDAIVGRYEVIDSMFRFGNLDTSTGLYPKYLDKIYRHPLVEVSKGTFFTNDKTWRSGVLFTIKQRDSSSHQFDKRGFVNNKVYSVEGSSKDVLLLYEFEGNNTVRGYFEKNEIFVEYSTVFPHEYSKSHLKRLA